MTNWTIMLRDKVIRQFSLNEGEQITIGRGKDCDITIDNTAISRQHISIAMHNGIYFISDLGSTNGSFVNGKKINTDEPISETDSIEFGKFALISIPEDPGVNKMSSMTADTMDMDDETIFVTNQHPTEGNKKQFKPKTEGPHLKVLQGNVTPSEISLFGKSSIKIGKEPHCELVLSGWFIAQAQCYIIKRDKGYYLVPQKSWVGTFVNNTKTTNERLLRPGDIITIRQISIRFE